MKNNNFYKQYLKTKTFISTTPCNLNAIHLRHQKRNMSSLLKDGGARRYEMKAVGRTRSLRALRTIK